MIEGVTIQLGGEGRIIPPLNFRALRTLQPELTLLGKSPLGQGGFSDEQMTALCQVIHAALARNYPDVTLDQLEDWIDLGNAPAVIAAVMAQSGLVRAGGEKKTMPTSPPTGTASIAPSSAPSAGAGSTSTST